MKKICLLQGNQGWRLSHRRAQLLGAIDAALRTLESLDTAVAAWATHSAAAESALLAAAAPPGERTTAAATQLHHYLELRRQWLGLAAEHAAGLARLGQAVLHLELSRYVPLSSSVICVLSRVTLQVLLFPLFPLTPVLAVTLALLGNIFTMLCREGRPLMGASGILSSCEAFGPMLSQMQLLCSACAGAIAEVHSHITS